MRGDNIWVCSGVVCVEWCLCVVCVVCVEWCQVCVVCVEWCQVCVVCDVCGLGGYVEVCCVWKQGPIEGYCTTVNII